MGNEMPDSIRRGHFVVILEAHNGKRAVWTGEGIPLYLQKEQSTWKNFLIKVDIQLSLLYNI